MLRVLLFLILVACLASCSKSLDDKQQQIAGFSQFGGILGDSVYNYVLLSSSQLADDLDSSLYITATAAFKNTITGQLDKVQSLSINNRVILPVPDNTYDFNYGDSLYPSPEGASLYGTNVSIRLDGFSGADTVTQSVYMSQNMMRSIRDFPSGTIDAGQPETLTWVSDPDKGGNVLVQLIYNPGLSHLSDPTLPANISTVTFTVPDNGSYMLPATGLQAFPNKSYIEIWLTRGTQHSAVLPLSKRKVYFVCLNTVHTAPLFVKKP